jgi:exopolysaccharide production protein ExoZ
MRGLAALLVFFVHFSALLGSYAEPESALQWATGFAGSLGNSGVDIFFIISGFLMYGIVMSRPTPFLTYLGRRAKRLYPVYIAVFLIYVAISYSVPSLSRIPASRGAALGYIVANLAMLPGMFAITPLITVAWSLSYEWFFYLLLPLTVWALRMRGWTPVRRIVFVLTICVVQYTLCDMHVSAHPRLIMFGAGICLWELGTHWRLGGRLGYRGELAAIFLAAVSLAWVGFDVVRHDTSLLGRMTILPIDSPVLFLGLSPFVLYSLFFQGWLNRFFSLRGLRWFGNASYSYYLIHGLTLHFVATIAHLWLGNRILPPAQFMMMFVVSLAATLGSASLLYLAIEKPFSLSSTGAADNKARSAAVVSLPTTGPTPPIQQAKS